MKIAAFLESTGAWISIAIISIIAIINFLFTLCYTSPYSVRNPYFDVLSSAEGLIAASVIAFLLFSTIRNLDNHSFRKVLLSSIMIVFSLSLIWILFTQYISITDTESIMNNAMAIIHGTETPDIIYMLRFPYQSGMLLYVMLFEAVFQTNNTDVLYLIMEYANIIPVCLTAVLLILITKELSDERTAKIAALIISGFITIPLTVIQVYGNILSFPIILTAIYLTIKLCNAYENKTAISKTKIIIYTISIILLCFMSGFIKQNNLIIGIAMTICMLIVIIKNIKNNHENNILFMSAFIILTLAIIPAITLGNNTAINIVSSFKGYDYNSNANMIQPAKVFIGMGMSDESDHGPGFYNTKGNKRTPMKTSVDFANKTINDRINQIKTAPAEFIWFMMRKITYTWSDPTFQYATRPAMTLYNKRNTEQNCTGYDHKCNSDENWKPVVLNETWYQKITDSTQMMIILRTITDGVSTIISLFAIIGLYLKRKNIISILLAISVTGGFMFHLVWETQPEYAYTYFILLIPYASMGLNMIKMPILCKHNKN